MKESTPFSKKFSARLKSERESRGFSQSELAEKAKLMPSAISHFEAGRRSPSFDNLRRLADALQVTIDYLSGRTDKKEQPSTGTQMGPAVDKLFRQVGKLTDRDIENLADFAELLANKNDQKTE